MLGWQVELEYLPDMVSCSSSEDCCSFNLDPPDFSLALETMKDIEDLSEMWSLYEEFQSGLQEMAKEDWITFR